MGAKFRRISSGEMRTGDIQANGAGDSLHLADGDAIELWGLSITDRQRAEHLLIGLTARCATLPNTFGYRNGDCSGHMPDETGTFGRRLSNPLGFGFPWISLFGPLPENGQDGKYRGNSGFTLID